MASAQQQVRQEVSGASAVATAFNVATSTQCSQLGISPLQSSSASRLCCLEQPRPPQPLRSGATRSRASSSSAVSSRRWQRRQPLIVAAQRCRPTTANLRNSALPHRRQWRSCSRVPGWTRRRDRPARSEECFPVRCPTRWTSSGVCMNRPGPKGQTARRRATVAPGQT
jgi:hypothetical protein